MLFRRTTLIVFEWLRLQMGLVPMWHVALHGHVDMVYICL